MIVSSAPLAHIAIISAGRAPRVPAMHDLLGPELVAHTSWYVRAEDVPQYTTYGAQRLVPAGGLIDSRNQALEDAFAQDLPCLQLSDDLQKVQRILPGRTVVALDLPAMLTLLRTRLYASRLMLAGVAPTNNPYFSRTTTSQNTFVVGDCILVRPSSPRFDRALRLKEDYDFTLQHWRTYGGTLRSDDVLCTFGHRTNAGGAVMYRTTVVEDTTIDYLKQKWGSAIRDNPRRPHEILLNWRAILQKAPVR